MMRNLIEDVILVSCLSKVIWGRWDLLRSLTAVIEERYQYYGNDNANR